MEHALYALYVLSFIPVLVITMTVHEAGHFLTGRFLGIRPSGFQIGIGPRLHTRYFGRGFYIYADSRPAPEPGQRILVQLETEASGTKDRIVKKWIPLPDPKKRGATDEEAQMTAGGPCIAARVAAVRPEGLTLADTAFILAPVPLAAMVFFPEDPAGTRRGFINTSGWLTQMMIVTAGAGANMLLLFACILALAAMPIARPGQQIVAVGSVMAGSPAEAAGIRPGDALLQANDVTWPSTTQLRAEIEEAWHQGTAVRLKLQRETEVAETRVRPEPGTGRIGVMLEPAYLGSAQRAEGLTGRFVNLSETYFTSLAAIFHPPKNARTQEPRVSGLIAAAKSTADAVQSAKLKAWIAVLGVITLSAALLNLLPIPPLDGFQALLCTLRKLRGGRDLNPRLEAALTLTGLSLIGGAAVFLAISDAIHIAGG